MRALPFLAIGGLAAFLVIYWIMPYHPSQLQDDRMPSSMPDATLGGPTRRPSDAQGRRLASGAGADDVQALVDRILARPLFNPDRRPAIGTAASGPASLPRLTAVLVSSRGKTAIFAGGADGKPVVLSEGGRIGNYLVRSIGAGQITVSGPDGVKVMRPTPDNTAQAAEPNLAAQTSMLDLLRQGASPIVFPGLQSPAPR